jgi:outer membrane protein OmpA-like peptidoglycan-associated protein
MKAKRSIVLAALAGALVVAATARAQVVNRSSRPRPDATTSRLAAGLAGGRLVLTELTFAAGSEQLDSGARPLVRRLAAAINASEGAYLIEGHVDDTGDRARDLALSQRRALEVKALLILEGVPPERLVAVGYGATSPPAGDGGAGQSARIEVARAQ